MKVKIKLRSPQLVMIAFLFATCSSMEKDVVSQGWQMHIIDNTSFGSDGTKVKDVNGDGHQDIICGWEQGHVARLYFNPYPDTIWTFVEVVARDVEDALLTDLDGDGNQDIVTFSEGDHRRISFHFAPAKEHYQNSNQWVSKDVPSTIGLTQWMFGQPMDVDQKNGIDLIVAAKNDGAILGWLEAPEDPRNVAAWTLHEIAPASWVMSIEIVDINHDGRNDVLISDRNGQTNGVKWFEHPGADTTLLKAHWSEQLIGMKNSDPMFLDLHLNQETGLYEIWVPNLRDDLFYFKQLDRLGTQWQSNKFPFPAAAGLVGKSAALADINKDGNLDVITTYDGAEERVGVMWSSFDATGSQWQHHNVSGLAGNKYDFAYPIDLNQDGAIDILTSEENNNSSTVAGLGVVWYENPLTN